MQIVSSVNLVPCDIQVHQQDQRGKEANIDVLPDEEWNERNWTDHNLQLVGVAPSEGCDIEVHGPKEQRQNDQEEEGDVVACLLAQLAEALPVLYDTWLVEERHVEEPDEVNFETDWVKDLDEVLRTNSHDILQECGVNEVQ